MTEEKDINRVPKKLIKHFLNGVTHNLILWIISKETIHGYGIMKRIDKFFNFEDAECDMTINSSKIYPILSAMENSGLIAGEWKINENNKRVKYYSITDDGLKVLEKIKRQMTINLSNPSWQEFFEDMTGKEINNEKRN
ncbi:MAG: PadR family transcriptional regulator [Methanobrevibacter sp.]|uniref:PadR family transcriptional regulator n=1 Tax=Methanobrevibacter sp. TaxID=66852 RepID=UPI0025CD1021|nr:PadR family transcriptional regulator [Methanobrevibacter sp.]MBQ8016491.1 PadR family transcriptional regulator [Methanobrevibacter sp.]